MARFDDRSTHQPVVMFFNASLATSAPDITSLSFDTAQYDTGYTVILITRGIGPADSFNFEVLTSDSPTSGFTVVPNENLVGGAIPQINNAFAPDAGDIAVSRGVIDDKRYVRIRLFNIVAGLSDMAVVVLNGAVDESPPSIPETTQVVVV